MTSTYIYFAYTHTPIYLISDIDSFRFFSTIDPEKFLNPIGGISYQPEQVFRALIWLRIEEEKKMKEKKKKPVGWLFLESPSSF